MTHTMKHTPGPWEVVGSRICTVANDRDRITLAKTEPGGAFAMSEQQEANATLLAAAPAMYEALVETMKVLRSLRDNKEEWYTLVTPELLKAWDKNKAALAQAEGRDK